MSSGVVALAVAGVQGLQYVWLAGLLNQWLGLTFVTTALGICLFLLTDFKRVMP